MVKYSMKYIVEGEKMLSISLEDFYKENSKLSIDNCPKCAKKVELVFSDYSIQLDRFTIEVKELPQLECTNCQHRVLLENSKRAILYLYQECKKNNKLAIKKQSIFYLKNC